MKDWVKEVLQEGMILRYQDDEDALMDWFQETVRSVNPNRRVFEPCHKETSMHSYRDLLESQNY